MKKLAVSILIALTVGCGKANTTFSAKPQVIDPAFTSQVASFQSDLIAHGRSETVTSTIIFGEAPLASEEGFCDYGSNTVTISPEAWKNLNDLEKKFLIYHELGHCTLFKAHEAQTEAHSFCTQLGMGWTQTNCPAQSWTTVQLPLSIMNATVPVSYYVNVSGSPSGYTDSLITELFKN